MHLALVWGVLFWAKGGAFAADIRKLSCSELLAYARAGYHQSRESIAELAIRAKDEISPFEDRLPAMNYLGIISQFYPTIENKLSRVVRGYLRDPRASDGSVLVSLVYRFLSIDQSRTELDEFHLKDIYESFRVPYLVELVFLDASRTKESFSSYGNQYLDRLTDKITNHPVFTLNWLAPVVRRAKLQPPGDPRRAFFLELNRRVEKRMSTKGLFAAHLQALELGNAASVDERLDEAFEQKYRVLISRNQPAARTEWVVELHPDLCLAIRLGERSKARLYWKWVPDQISRGLQGVAFSIVDSQERLVARFENGNDLEIIDEAPLFDRQATLYIRWDGRKVDSPVLAK